MAPAPVQNSTGTVYPHTVATVKLLVGTVQVLATDPNDRERRVKSEGHVLMSCSQELQRREDLEFI